MPGEDNGMGGDVCACTDHRGLKPDLVVVVRIVPHGKDAREGTDDRVIADGDAAAVVEQGALANGDAVADGEVIAEVRSTPW